MKSGKLLLVWLSLSTWGRCYAVPRIYDVSSPPEKSVITLTSKALNEEFDGVAERVQGLISLDLDKSNLGLSGKFSVPVESMNTGLSLRDKHMKSKDWLDQEKYPLIRFELSTSEVPAVVKKSEGRWSVMAKGQFTMKGQTKEISVPALLSLDPKNPDMISVEAQFKVHLDDFNVRGPAGLRMIGIRVAPDVDVKVKLRGRAQGMGMGSNRNMPHK